MKSGQHFIDLTKTVSDNLNNEDQNKLQIDQEWNQKSLMQPH